MTATSSEMTPVNPNSMSLSTSPSILERGSQLGDTSMLEAILRQVEHIRAVQDQQTIKLDVIERNQQTSVIQQLQRPATMPTLPVSNKQEYNALQEFISDR